MSFLAKGKKQDLFILARELNVEVEENFKIIELKDAIIKSQAYDEEFTKELLNEIVMNRKEGEDRELRESQLEREERDRQREREERDRQREREEKENERMFELEKLKIQASLNVNNKFVSESVSSTVDADFPRLEIKKLIQNFNEKTDDMSLFLNLFERQMSFLKIPQTKWVVYLIGLLPSEIAKLIVKETDTQDNSQDYENAKKILLRRFKISAEKFRQQFVQHRKNIDSTWRDFYYDLRNFFEGWIEELKITTFDALKDLMIADQIKRRCPPDYRDHFLDYWSEWVDPITLADKLDSYEEVRLTKNKCYSVEPRKKEFVKYWQNEVTSNSRNINHGYKSSPPRNINKGEERSLKCYGCGKQGFIKAKCPNCSPSTKVGSAQLSGLNFKACTLQGRQTTLLKIKINGMLGLACADTGASHSIAGESLFQLLESQGVEFCKTRLNVTLADGIEKNLEVHQTKVDIDLEGNIIPITLFALPTARDNRTLLGTDFLSKAGIILDVSNNQWHFTHNPRQRFNFAKDEFQTPCVSKEKVVDVQTCLLKVNEGKHLTEEQKLEISELLEKYECIFKPGGEATPYIEHRINTGDHPPISVAPYRISHTRKELLKKEIEDLLENGIIEECESAYAAPVVLVPKPNGKIRLCVDYRKLNEVTVQDSYPLPRMDDLLQDAGSSEFMSTIDLKSGYHQVNVHPADRDKTAFVCPFGTFRYKRMPFGLKNAPATFQRLMDQFCRGLPALPYLDDLIVISPSFEKHLEDLEKVFKKLMLYKLRANREKCSFVCSKVKYLGLWITPQGLEVDPEKVSAILKIPTPNNVKQLLSFLQTCSWYRKFIPNFSQISQPLSNLTRKKTPWNWTEKEQKAFESLKQCLVAPPILQQADFTKPFTIRTDASSYALGAVLLQGEGNEEHPIEYASRLLTPAEKNYSTTEREALAMVWALNKFRGYVEGTKITVASDHQPLKWLMNLKSPTGRLARWALQIQSFNLNIEYLSGKSNVVADMLSRPVGSEVETSCELSTVSIDFPRKTPRQLREEQLKDEDLAKIINCFENNEKSVDYANWSERGYLMSQGVLYRYSPESESEEAQLVVPIHERKLILQKHHDDPTAGHYGAEGTFDRISKRYYWTGMRKFITDYVKNCLDCNRFKANNQKPAGLLRTPVPSQRFETLSIDLFGPLPESHGKRWILILEDCTTKWVELFALENATAKECAVTLLEEVFMRYGLPRQIISDNGPQFISAVMQQLCSLFNIHQSLTPVYHPQANPVERKNRDLKPRLAILVRDKHDSWSEKLPMIRFALNTAKSQSTGQTAAFLNFGRELRSTDDVTNDIRSVIYNDNFVPEITPYLKKFTKFMSQARETLEKQQDQKKFYADKKRKVGPQYQPGDYVYVNLHPISSALKGRSAKFMPRRDGPFVILSRKSPSSYEIANVSDPLTPIGVYHTSAMKEFKQNADSTPLQQLRRRGRPPKQFNQSATTVSGSSSRRHRNQRGRL